MDSPIGVKTLNVSLRFPGIILKFIAIYGVTKI